MDGLVAKLRAAAEALRRGDADVGALRAGIEGLPLPQWPAAGVQWREGAGPGSGPQFPAAGAWLSNYPGIVPQLAELGRLSDELGGAAAVVFCVAVARCTPQGCVSPQLCLQMARDPAVAR